MNQTLHRLLVSLLFLTLILFLAGASLMAASQDQIERTFEVSSGGLLTIRSDRGSIEITSGERSEVRVEIEPKGWDLDDLEDRFDIRFDQSGNHVTVEIKSKGTFSRWFNFGRKSLEIRAVVPFEFNVDLKTSGGSISVADLRGEVKGATSGGSLSFGSIEGAVWGRTSGGSISLSECVGDADVHTSGGSIKLGDVDGSVEAVTSGGSISVVRAGGRVVARTSGGGIVVDDLRGSINAKTSGGSIRASISRQPEGECRLETSGGSVTVSLASELGFEVDAKASGGRVNSDLPVTSPGSIAKRSLKRTLNGGGPLLFLRTSGGSIYIKEFVVGR